MKSRLLILVLSYALGFAQQADCRELSKDDYAVYAAVIQQKWKKVKGFDSLKIVVRTVTVNDDMTYETVRAIIDSGGGLSKRSWQRTVGHVKDRKLLDSTMGEIVGNQMAGELARDFSNENVEPSKLGSAFTDLANVVLLDEEDRHEMLAEDTLSLKRNGFWPSFYKRFPNALELVSFSRIGFSHDSVFAVVYLEYESGPLAGRAELVLLENRDGSWTIRRRDELWIT